MVMIAKYWNIKQTSKFETNTTKKGEDRTNDSV